MAKIRIASVSDTHTYHKSITIPKCDILIHSGDATYHGRQEEVEEFGSWFRSLPVEHKIYVPGNHDKSFENDPESAQEWLGFNRDEKASVTKQKGVKRVSTESKAQNIVQVGKCYYLHQEAININGLKIYGDGSTPSFGYGWAFNVDRGAPIAEVWQKIPDDTNVLITHGPPYGILDLTGYRGGGHVGCEELYRKTRGLSSLIVHQFGHIHEGAGYEKVGDTLFVNASSCTQHYNPTNKVIVVDVEQVNGVWQVVDYSTAE